MLDIDELLSLHNIIKDSNGNYALQHNYYKGEEQIKSVVPYDKWDCHNCATCSYGTRVSSFDYSCDIYNKLTNQKDDCFAYTSMVVNCAAYDEIKQLNIIRSIDDMIEFICKTENVFSSTEDYENYYGFERMYDEKTGDILETTKEYYRRGGIFENIPTQYPCVISFNLSKELKWIYIGEDK